MGNIIGKFARKNLARKQGWKCYYCPKLLNEMTLTIDHRIPLSRGGSRRSKSNMVVCCYYCNARKGDMTTEEFFIFLKIKEIRVNGGLDVK